MTSHQGKLSDSWKFARRRRIPACNQTPVDIKAGRACQPAAEGQVCAVFHAKSDDYLSAKDNRLQYPPPRQAEGLSRDTIKTPSAGILRRLQRPVVCHAGLPTKKEGGRLTLSTTRRLPPAKLGLFARSRRLGNYLLDRPLLPSNHQMQINKSGRIISAITRRKMTKIKRRRHS